MKTTKRRLDKPKGSVMGEAKNNPNSQKFTGRVRSPGDVPSIPFGDFDPRAWIQVVATPTKEWFDKNGAAYYRGEDPPLPDIEDSMLTFYLVGGLVKKSALLPEAEWQNGGGAIKALYTIPFKQAADAWLKRAPAPSPAPAAEDAPPATDAAPAEPTP